VNRLLFIEDEPQLQRAMRITLAARGYDVQAVLTARNGLAEAAAGHPDIIVLDLGLPDMDGIDLIAAIRGWSTVPIIVLSGRTSGEDKVAALDAGADDYITKPFGMEELLARIRAVARRTGATGDPPTVDIGAYHLDLTDRRIHRRPHGGPRSHRAAPGGAETAAANETRLTPTEWRLLEALVRHPGKLVTQQQLITEVWGPAYTGDTSSLRLYVNRLRRKLEPDPSRPRYLLTEPGMGYRFQPTP
jgi:two-component system, OmpR family, KDP operon response regulator KdpE